MHSDFHAVLIMELSQFFILFFGNFIFGYLFITRWLIYSTSLHFLFGTRLAVVVWILG